MKRIALALALVLPLAACAVEVGPGLEEMPPLPGTEGKADGNASTPEGRAILFELKALYRDLRPLKAELFVGETHDGYVTIVPSQADRLAEDADRAATARNLVARVNDARRRWYDLEVAKYRSQLTSQIAASLASVRQQVMAKVCAELALPVGPECANLGAEQIDAAIQAALDSALTEAMAAVRRGVEEVHADFWMRKTTKVGEYIELPEGDGSYGWYKKP